MTDHVPSSPHNLSLFYNNQPLLELDVFLLILRIIAIIYLISIFFCLRETGVSLFHKVAEGLARLNDSVGFPPSFDFNYKRETSIENDTATDDENARGDPTQRPANSSEVTSTLPVHPHALCSACQGEIKTPRPSSSDSDSVLEPPAPESSISKPTAKLTISDSNPASYAAAALTSLAADLEFDVSHLTQVEADDILAELQHLRSTVGSRASLFTKPSAGSVHDPDAWYGEACLIDALIWLLRKRFPVQRGVNLDFSGFEPGKERKKAEEETKSKANKSQGHRFGNMEQRNELEMQSEDEDESKNGRSSSGSRPSGHTNSTSSVDDPLTFCFRDTPGMFLPFLLWC
jgi:hypothetical protein